MGKRVPVLDPDGVFGTIDEADIEKLPEGARVLTRQDVAERRAEEEYAGKSTAAKVAGALAPALPLPAQAIARGLGAALPPELEAYRAGASDILTGGLEELGTKSVAEQSGGEEAGQRYVEGLDTAKEAFPTAHAAGQVAGIAASVVAGGPKGGLGKAASAIPGVALSTAGEVAERGAARALGGLAAKGALGRAAATGASMAVRGAVEGAAFGGLQQATESAVHDDPVVGEKLYAAMGHGALVGGTLGGILGTTGSLVGSAARGARGALFSRGVEAAEPALEEASRRRVLVNPNAGLDEAAPEAERALSIGPETRKIGLRPDVFARARTGAAEVSDRKPFTFKNVDVEQPDKVGLRIDAFASPRTKAAEASSRRPFTFKNTPSRLFDMESGPIVNETSFRMNPNAGLTPSELAKGEETADAFRLLGQKAETETRFRLNPNAGLTPSQTAAGEQASNVFRFLKSEPRSVSLNTTGSAVDVGAGPIQIGEQAGAIGAREAEATAAAAPKRKLGLLDLLSAPNDAARAMANDQAWRAVGGGFGLQSTRYAKQAAKYFPNGTSDLGATAMKYGIVDVTETANPFQAAWKAAREGTPADMVPKLANATDRVGKQIAEITDTSGARVPLAKALAAVESVAKEYSGDAGRGALTNATRQYGEELASVLRPAPDGTVSVQDLLKQRKVLDEIVYDEAKTLDPRGRVAALRKVRANLENLITDSLDEASGQVPDKLREQYKALKKDYHALRILSEVAEDSAARSSKGAMFGLAEKAGLLVGAASGHGITAPALALGSKFAKERGNAAAAAFLTRAADTGMIADVVGRFDRRVARAAAGVLREPPTSRAAPARQTAESVADARARMAATQARAQRIVSWVGDVRANPAEVQRQLEEASSIVSRAGGPKAAESYTAATLRAINFIAGHIPVRERRDPLDPKSVPQLTHDEAIRLIRAANYATQPSRVFDDFERGIVTPEGIRAANIFMPSAFADFRTQLQEHVEDHMARGGRLTATQRLRLDKLLGYPAGADLRPAALARLQANLALKPPEMGAQAATVTGKPVDMKVQQTGFDAIEARKSAS